MGLTSRPCAKATKSKKGEADLGNAVFARRGSFEQQMKMKISRSEGDVFCSVAREKKKKKFPALRFWWCAKYAGNAADKESVPNDARRPLGLRQRHGVAPHCCQDVFVFQLPNGDGDCKKKHTQRRLKTHPVAAQNCCAPEEIQRTAGDYATKVRARRTVKHQGESCWAFIGSGRCWRDAGCLLLADSALTVWRLLGAADLRSYDSQSKNHRFSQIYTQKYN